MRKISAHLAIKLLFFFINFSIICYLLSEIVFYKSKLIIWWISGSECCAVGVLQCCSGITFANSANLSANVGQSGSGSH